VPIVSQTKIKKNGCGIQTLRGRDIQTHKTRQEIRLKRSGARIFVDFSCRALGCHTFPADAEGIGSSSSGDILDFFRFISGANEFLAVIWGCLKPKYQSHSMKGPKSCVLVTIAALTFSTSKSEKGKGRRLVHTGQRKFNSGSEGRVSGVIIIILLFPFLLPLEHGASMKRSVSLQFLNQGQPVGLLGRVISSSQDLYLHRTTQTQNKRIRTHKHPCLE
jgi:hypothetical protein